MKFKTGLLLGIGIGYVLGSGKKVSLGADEPIVRHPDDVRRSRRPVVDLGRRLSESASHWGLRAIDQARGAIRDRLDATDDPSWN